VRFVVGFWGSNLLGNTALFGFSELGGVGKMLVYHFMLAACHFRLDVLDCYFAVFLSLC